MYGLGYSNKLNFTVYKEKSWDPHTRFDNDEVEFSEHLLHAGPNVKWVPYYFIWSSAYRFEFTIFTISICLLHLSYLQIINFTHKLYIYYLAQYLEHSRSLLNTWWMSNKFYRLVHLLSLLLLLGAIVVLTILLTFTESYFVLSTLLRSFKHYLICLKKTLR